MPIQNFNFTNKTRILFGRQTIPQLTQYLPRDKYFLICYGGGSIKKNGIYDAVVKALDGRKYEEFGGIEPNPDYDTLMKCVEKCRQLGLDNLYLLAVGGGSVIDGVKFIVAAAYFEGDPWEIVKHRGSNIERAIPFSSVLTLPATGSESNNGSVISRRSIKSKLSFYSEHIFPEVSVLDPDAMLSLPLRQIQNGVVDAFVHVCEQYITVLEDADPQDRYSEGLLITLLKNGERIMKDQTDYVARSNIMWAANQALNGLLKQGVLQDWTTHKMGHDITANLGLDHGQTLIIVQPRLFEYKIDTKKDKLALMCERVFDIHEGSTLDKAKLAIRKIESFYRDTMGMKTKLSELDCSQDKKWIDNVIDRISRDNLKYGEHADILPNDVKEIYYRCY